jgi:hypothetical protein
MEEEKIVQFTAEELARIDDYAQRMHDPKNGIEIKDRKYKLKTYPQCFLGNEAVTWMNKNFQMTSEDAMKLGNQMIELGIIHHVSFEHTFKNEGLYYRFQMDDKSSTLNSKKVWVVAARPANIVAIELLARIVEIYQANFSDGNLDKKLLKQVRSSAEFVDFATATAELQKVDIASLNHVQRLTFFLNIHNVLVLHAMIDVEKLPGGGPGWFWLSRGSKYNIAGDDYSMLEIYHGILRAAMNAPKIPFGSIFFKFAKPKEPTKAAQMLKVPEALICFGIYHNTMSSPVLRLYTESDVYNVIKAASEEYLLREVSINLEKNKIALPKFFYWFSKDFGLETSDKDAIVKALEVLLPDQLRLDLAKVEKSKISLSYSDYNWKPFFRVDKAEYERIKLVHAEIQEREKLEKVSRVPVFGMTFAQLAVRFPNTKLPPFFTKCLEHIERKGIDTVGIFRLAGSSMQILSLQQLCSADQDINYDQFDIHSVATFIKRFLRNIPEPIIPYDAVDEILRIPTSPFPEEVANQIRIILKRTMDRNSIEWHMLVELITFLKRIDANANKNMMNSYNLAIVFGPTILKLRDTNPSAQLTLTGIIGFMCQILIDFSQGIFS